MNPVMKKIIFYAKILFITGLFVWVAYKFDFKAARGILAAASIKWAAISILATFISLIFVSLRWKMIIQGFWHLPRSTVAQLYSYNLLGSFYTLFLPTTIAGEAVRVWRLAKNEDKDYAKAAFTAILDRVIGLATWFILFLTLPSLLPKNKLLLLVFLVPIVLYIFRHKLAFKEKKLLDFSRHHPLDVAYGLVFSLLCQFCYIIAGYAALKCFNIHVSLLHGAGLVAAGALTGLIPVSVLGFGAREGFFIVTLPLYGALPTQAVLFTSFFVFVTYLTGIAGGLIELTQTGWKLSSLGKSDIESIGVTNEKT